MLMVKEWNEEGTQFILDESFFVIFNKKKKENADSFAQLAVLQHRVAGTTSQFSRKM